jgi:hypothetical protein
VSHVLDSGLADAQRTLIANAIATKLAPLKLQTLGGSSTGFLEAIEIVSFAIDGKHDDHGIDMLLELLKDRMPAVAIAPIGLRNKPAGGIGKGLAELDVDVYFVSAHRRELVEGRATMDPAAIANDARDPGIFVTVELVWALLQDQDLGLGTGIQQLKLQHETELLTSRQETVWKQEWKIAVARDVNLYRGLTEKFTTAHTTLKPTGDEPAAKHMVEDTPIG